MENNNVRYAGFVSRFVASLIDGVVMVVYGVIVFIFFFFLHMIFKENEQLSKMISVFQFMIPILVILLGKITYRWFKDPKNGTLGRKITRTQVVNEVDLLQITTSKSFGRQLMYSLLDATAIILFINFVFVLTDEKKQTLVDKIFKTVVIKK